MIKLKELLLELMGEVGKPITFGHKEVIIFKAMRDTIDDLKYNDTVLKSRRDSISQAKHMSETHHEPYHVMKYLVKSENLFDASFPNTYHYTGPLVAGNEVFHTG